MPGPISTNHKITIFILVSLALSSVLLFSIKSRADFPEVKEVAAMSGVSFSSLASYFTTLAENKGAVYAFEVLERISVPPGIDMHLLGHMVGNVLYKQKGIEGISVCTQDFKNACSHAIVVSAFIENGEAAIPKIREACGKAPGGKKAYEMCYHGLGHGVLSYVGYEFPEAVDLCKKVGMPEYAECVGGAVMELMSGGFHDRGLWEAVRPKYLHEENPLSLCSQNTIPDREAQEKCFTYITPYIFEVVGADLAKPTGENFKEAFRYCDTISASEAVLRDACFRGFGKEFVGLVLGWDVRTGTITNITDEQLVQVYDWCLLANNREGSAACIFQAIDSLFWGGENDPGISVKFCMLMEDEYYKQSCMRYLMQTAAYYTK